MDHPTIIETTRRWISSVVIGLNLCPFAQRVFDAERIRYVVSDALDGKTLLGDLRKELQLLAATPSEKIATTLLIYPQALGDFLDSNDFVGDAEQLVADMNLEGVIQLASFHPNYQFADAEPDAVENYTNRAPFPMLHLLREESVTEVADDEDALLEIPQRNIEKLQALGRERILEMLRHVVGQG